MVTLDDNVEWFYDGISESERVKVIEGYLGDIDIRIKAHPNNEAKCVRLKISPDSKYGAPGYHIIPAEAVNSVSFFGIENLKEQGYLVEKNDATYIAREYVVKREGVPSFHFWESNGARDFPDDLTYLLSL